MRPNGLEDQQHNTGGNADIGHIEDTGAEAADAEIHEINHATIMNDAIQEISQAAGESSLSKLRKAPMFPRTPCEPYDGIENGEA